LYNKYFVDEGYDYAFTGRRKVGNTRLGVMGLGDAASWFDTHVVDGLVNFTGWLTRGSAWLSSMFDKIVIDGIGVNGPAYFAWLLSFPVKLLQWGLVQWYALVMIVGLVYFVCASLGLQRWFWGVILSIVGVGLIYALASWLRKLATRPSSDTSGALRTEN